MLGVEAQVATDLVGAGMLTQHLNECAGDAAIEKEALTAFVNKLHRYPALPRDLGETVPLRKLARNGYSLVRILQLVLDGRLLAVWLGGDLYNLQVSHRGFQSLI